jgi:hypothetical protein
MSYPSPHGHYVYLQDIFQELNLVVHKSHRD